MDIPQGTLLYNRYRIERQLGQGGMGAVYLAMDTSLETWVAVKINHSTAGDSAGQFLREAHLLASLRNSHLPRVIDYFLLDQNQYLVMDFIPGDDLYSLLHREGAQPVEKVLKWARQLGDALTYLHNQNPPIVHRDIKPANIKLNNEGEAVLVDFGIAKSGDTSQATATGAAGYTPGYAPPEQYGGAHTGPYSDQYAFAATLYALLTGFPPADSIQRVLGKASLDPIQTRVRSVPESVDLAIQHALTVRPDERFPSVADFVQALTGPATLPAARQTIPNPQSTLLPGIESTIAPAPHTSASRTASGATQFASGQATLMPPVSAPPASAPPASAPRRKTGWIIAAVLVALLIVGGTGFAFVAAQLGWFGGGKTALVAPSPTATAIPTQAVTPTPAQVVVLAASPTPQPTVPPAPTETLLPTVAAPTEAPAPSLPSATPAAVGGGGRIAFLSNRGEDKTYQIWTMQVGIATGGQVSAFDFQQLTHSAGNITQLAWSPDGKQLLFVAPGGIINGKNLGLDIWVMSGDGSGNPSDLTRRPGDDRDPAWSPDGAHIAFSNDGREDKIRQLFMMDADGSNQARLSDQLTEFMPTWSPDMKYLAFVISANSYPFLYIRSSQDGFVAEGPYDRNSITGRLGQVAEPSWSPDGTQIAYVRLDGGNKQIWSVIFDSGGSSTSRLSQGPADQDPAWSPDAHWLLYSGLQSGKRDLILITSAGTLQTNLTSDAADDLEPAWQPSPQ